MNKGKADNITIRPMREADYENAVALWGTTAGVGLNEADHRENICRYLARNPELSQVAEVKGHFAGAVLCGHDGRRGYMHHLAVASDFRRNGIGQSLVEECAARLAREGIGRCHLFVYPDNEQGLMFWRRMGFEQRHDIQICSRDL
jgi:N-acetylglutamate synthase